MFAFFVAATACWGAVRGRVTRTHDLVLPCLLAGAAVVMVGGLSIGFVLGLLYASQRQRALPAIMYRIASKEVDAVGLADLALAEVEIV